MFSTTSFCEYAFFPNWRLGVQVCVRVRMDCYHKQMNVEWMTRIVCNAPSLSRHIELHICRKYTNDLKMGNIRVKENTTNARNVNRISAELINWKWHSSFLSRFADAIESGWPMPMRRWNVFVAVTFTRLTAVCLQPTVCRTKPIHEHDIRNGQQLFYTTLSMLLTILILRPILLHATSFRTISG